MNLKGKTALVAGGAGFIGSHAARRLHELGLRVRILDAGPKPSRGFDEFEYVQGSVTDRALVDQVMKGVDLVVNAAALVQEGGSFELFRRVNVEGAVRLAESARRSGIKLFVQFSSVMVYGFDYPAMVRETGPFGGNENPYCQTKIEGELALLQMHRPGTFDICIVRPGDVYGPGSVPWVIRPFRLMKSYQFMLVDGGNGTMNHVYIDNLIDAVILLVEKNATGRAYNVTDGGRTTFREYFQRLAREAGRGRLPSLPYNVARAVAWAAALPYKLFGRRPEVSADSIPFVTRPHPVSIEAITALGFVPRVTLDEGIERTMEWLRSVNYEELHPFRPQTEEKPSRYRYAALIGVILLAYLLFFPVKIDPGPYVAQADVGYTGPFAPNQKLADIKMLPISAHGPEHVVVDSGWIYAAVDSGAILRMRADGSSLEEFVQTGGRPLGFAFDAKKNLIIADAVKGLLLVTAKKEIHVITDQVDGKPLQFTDAVVVSKSGKIYFTDASMRFSARGGTFEASILDTLEHSCTGRLIEVEAGRAKVFSSGICFANGLALDSKEESVFVAETGEMRILRYWISGARKGVKEVFLDKLPGYPDNLMRGSSGKIWVGLPRPRSKFADLAAAHPILRKITLRLPHFLWPVPKPYGHVFAFDESGRIVADLQDPAGQYPDTTGVTETADRLYIQSLHAEGLGYVLAAGRTAQ
ncbi:MAG TPA: NAD-dependent epimerase/dehydratase family protein [Leptospiraceae bacterium]|nr:NAD-dependent epimerase/dehydratase family protein [Leptospiraceae bacterium]